MNIKIAATALSVAALASSGLAQLTAIGPFTGTYSDGFESPPDYAAGGNYSFLQSPDGFFSYTSNPSTDAELWIYNPGAGVTWGLDGNGSATVNSGNQALGLYDGGANAVVTVTFASAVTEFGGYFAADSDSGHMYASFFDQNGAFLGQEDLYHTGNTMEWSGFATSGSELISFVQFSGNGAPVMDDLQASPTPEPVSIAFLGFGALGLIARKRRRA